MKRVVLVGLLGALLVLPSAARADDEESGPTGEQIVRAYNTGFQWNVAPGFFLSTANKSVGFAIVGTIGYGFDAGSVIVVPGLRLTGVFPGNTSVLLGMPTFRFVFPIGGFAPFVMGGAGIGHITETSTVPGQTGIAWRGGGGFTYHFSVKFGLGAEVAYEAITGTDYAGLSIAPIISLAL
jgi:hypothetical protein